MEMPVFTEKLTEQLKAFVQQCMNDSSILHDPKLSFIKELIEHYGGKIPETKANPAADTKYEFKSEPAESEPQAESESESEDSDLELDMTAVIGLYIFLF